MDKQDSKCVTQFLIQRTLHVGFNQRILEALAENNELKIAPKHWLKYLEEEGFKEYLFK